MESNVFARITGGISIVAAALLLAACPGDDPKPESVWVECGPADPAATCPAPTKELICPFEEISAAPRVAPSDRHNIMVINGLKTVSINAIANNPDVLGKLPLVSLRAMVAPGGLLDPVLVDPAAQQFLSYMVRCALDTDPDTAQAGLETIQWTGPNGESFAQGGEYDPGLCNQWLDDPILDEANPAADRACRERLSSCIAAYNNPQGKNVDISMRGVVAGQSLPAPPSELALYPVREGAFMGYLFDESKLDPRIRARVENNKVIYTYCPCDSSCAAGGQGGPCECTDFVVYDASLARDMNGNFDPAVARSLREGCDQWFLSQAQGHACDLVMHGDLWACEAETWDGTQAYLHDRLCAGPTGAGICAAQAVGTCFDSRTPSDSLCQTTDQSLDGAVSGDDDYDACDAGGTTWQEPLTIKLRGPCTAVSNARDFLSPEPAIQDEAMTWPDDGCVR